MPKPLPSSFLYVYVGVTGASVMALELAASRFLAPYFGTSMIVWANVIGLILLALSVGYWAGGRLADRRPDAGVLMVLSLAAGTWTSLIPAWGRLIFHSLASGIMNTPLGTIILSFVAILLVFAPPVFLLAMVSPFAIRLIATQPQNVGKVAGNLYAFSTLGSLIGTFGTAFGTIPFWGTQETIFSWSGALILISAWGLRRHRLLAFLLVIVPLGLYGWLGGLEKTGQNVLWSKDTLYQFVQVLKLPDRSTALVYNEGGGIQSLARPHDALSASDYFDDYLLLPFLISKPQDVLVLGSAGGTIPHLLATYDKPYFPRLNITGVEIDPAVIPLGYRYFHLKKSDATIVNQDARVFVTHTRQNFSIIIVDAYTQQIYIPFHLATREFFQTLRGHLRPGGIVAMNVNAISPQSRLLQSITKTVQDVFPYTYVVKSSGAYNYMLLGSERALNPGSLGRIAAGSSLRPIAATWPQKWAPAGPQPRGILLTDDRAPIDMLTDRMIFRYARNPASSR